MGINKQSRFMGVLVRGGGADAVAFGLFSGLMRVFFWWGGGGRLEWYVLCMVIFGLIELA